MFTKRSEHDEHLDEVIMELQEKLAKSDLSDADWKKSFDRLSQLKTLQREKKSVSPDTIAVIGANLVGLIMIMSFEKSHIITSKAFGNLLKPR